MLRSMVIGIAVVVLLARGLTELGNLSSQWVERTEVVKFRPERTKSYDVATQNGTIEFSGRDDASKDVELVAHCQVGARTKERAQQGLDAIEVTIDGKEKENCRVGWRWRGAPESDWSAVVDLTLRAPKPVALKAESQNGRVNVKNIAGIANLSTQNGEIDAQSSGEALDAETQNGQIRVKFNGRKVNLHSTNGRIAADLSDCGPIEGEIGTHNGVVQVRVGQRTSCKLKTKMHHGWRNSHGGKIGAGGGTLAVTSHNGAVLINGLPGADQDDDEN